MEILTALLGDEKMASAVGLYPLPSSEGGEGQCFNSHARVYRRGFRRSPNGLAQVGNAGMI
jgi:hypothetical protein